MWSGAAVSHPANAVCVSLLTPGPADRPSATARNIVTARQVRALEVPAVLREQLGVLGVNPARCSGCPAAFSGVAPGARS